jgi:hypothetical protein
MLFAASSAPVFWDGRFELDRDASEVEGSVLRRELRKRARAGAKSYRFAWNRGTSSSFSSASPNAPFWEGETSVRLQCYLFAVPPGEGTTSTASVSNEDALIEVPNGTSRKSNYGGRRGRSRTPVPNVAFTNDNVMTAAAREQEMRRRKEATDPPPMRQVCRHRPIVAWGEGHERIAITDSGHENRKAQRCRPWARYLTKARHHGSVEGDLSETGDTLADATNQILLP